jgi:uncharacterized OsmC-like protein
MGWDWYKAAATAGCSARQIKQQAKKNRCHQQRFLVSAKSNQR